jgi:hypothetical protein
VNASRTSGNLRKGSNSSIEASPCSAYSVVSNERLEIEDEIGPDSLAPVRTLESTKEVRQRAFDVFSVGWAPDF